MGRGRFTPALLALLLGLAPVSATAESESLNYEWRVKGFVGAVLGLFFPRAGEARLTTQESRESDVESTVLELTAEKRRPGDFYRYGADSPGGGSPTRLWSEYLYRGKARQKEESVEESGVLDFASAIAHLRSVRPTEPLELTLWFDAKRYPIVAIPREEELVPVGDVPITARHYRVQGRRVEGERFWKGRFGLWLANDEVATPVRIVGKKGAVTVRLALRHFPDAAGGGDALSATAEVAP
jgi:hypothetical protein